MGLGLKFNPQTQTPRMHACMLFNEELNEFTVRATKDSEEIHGLLEVGFEYVCQKDSLMFFRKRK